MLIIDGDQSQPGRHFNECLFATSARRGGVEGTRRRKIEASANLFDCRPRLTSSIPACGLLTPYGVYLSRVRQAYRPICAREHTRAPSVFARYRRYYITPDILIFRWPTLRGQFPVFSRLDHAIFSTSKWYFRHSGQRRSVRGGRLRNRGDQLGPGGTARV